MVTRSGSYRSNAEYLQGLVQEAKVVKGFNVLSAYALENGGLQGSKEVSVDPGVGGAGVRRGSALIMITGRSHGMLLMNFSKTLELYSYMSLYFY